MKHQFTLRPAFFFVAVIGMVLTGFRINPIWGVLNLSGFYFPVLWLAFWLLKWHRAKMEFLFALAAGVCIFYLSQHTSILSARFKVPYSNTGLERKSVQMFVLNRSDTKLQKSFFHGIQIILFAMYDAPAPAQLIGSGWKTQ